MIFESVLLAATFLCSLVAGFLFAFAVVVMPALRGLDDKQFIRSFQAIDGVIQDNNPLFLLTWVGSVIALVISVALGAGQLDSLDRTILLAAAVIYILGVQVPTFTINIPLNNMIQAVDVLTTSEAQNREAREQFESRWNRWNIFRTYLACIVTVLLMSLILRL